MSTQSHRVPSNSAMAWLMPALATGVVVAAVFSYGRSEERQAAPGSPYYGKAVQEAINGLKNLGANAPVPEGRPPLPEGLSPDDHYWCNSCKAYHKRDTAQNQHAGVPPPVSGVGADVAQSPDVIPPLPEGLSANDHYWCVNCKTYHARQPSQAVPGTGTSPEPWRGVPYPLSPATPIPGN